MKKNIEAQITLYPCPVIVVGAMVKGKTTWTLVAHAGTVRTLLYWNLSVYRCDGKSDFCCC